MNAMAQSLIISGPLRDGASGETLLGATVWSEDLIIGTSTNFWFHNSLPIGSQRGWLG